LLAIIRSGSVGPKPTEEEIKAGEAQSLKDDPGAEPLAAHSTDADAEKDKDIKGIPEFWLTALRNHMEISGLITERDEDALKSLTDIRFTYLADKPGYSITFHFSSNDYFSNEILTKTYYYQAALGYEGDYLYEKSEGTKILWKGDKDLTKSVEMRKQRNKNTNRTRLVRKTHSIPSFFDFFSPPSPPDPDAVENGDMEEDDFAELEEKLEVDYQIGEDLKDRIIPRAIDYFTGKALEYDLSDIDEDDDDDDDGEGFDDDDVSEEEIVPAPKKKAGNKAGGSANVDPGECKNQ